MPESLVPGPQITALQHKRAVDFVMSRLTILEPASIVGMWDQGKNVIFDSLCEKVKALDLVHTVKIASITNALEFERLIEELKGDVSPTILILTTTTKSDVSIYFEELDKLREVRETAFVPLAVEYVRDVYNALENKNKTLSRSMFVVSQIDFEDTVRLTADFHRRYPLLPTIEQNRIIYKWSGGHVGLIKSLYLLMQDSSEFLFNEENLLKEDSIILRLESILADIPADKIAELVQGKGNMLDKLFFEKFGYTVNGEPFSPLLKKYLQMKGYVFEKDYALDFTDTQQRAFTYLYAKKGNLVTREDLSKEIWVKQPTPYAIDQLIHRLRDKLEEANTRLSLKTKKGLGYVLVEV